MADKDKTKIFQAVASYTLDAESARDMPLVDYRAVVNELAAGRRAQFFMADIADYMEDYAGETPPGIDGAKPLQILQGAHDDKFRLSIIKAKDGDAPVFMPVCEDMTTGRLLVVGPGRALDTGAPVASFVYVDGSASDAVEAINNFLAEGFSSRAGTRATARGSHELDTKENLIQATTIIAELPTITEVVNIARRGGPPEIVASVPAHTTLGHCFHAVASGNATVAACMLARPYFDFEESHAQVMQGVSSDVKVGKPFSFKPKG